MENVQSHDSAKQTQPTTKQIAEAIKAMPFDQRKELAVKIKAANDEDLQLFGMGHKPDGRGYDNIA